MSVTAVLSQIEQAHETIHRTPVDEVYRVLGSQAAGLDQSEAQARLGETGPNVIRKAKGTPLWVRFAANFTHLMAILLWVGAVAGFVARMPQLAIAILLVNVINGAFSFWQEFRAERATEALRSMLPQNVRVLRDGLERLVPAEELVPGDVMLLTEGDRISADGRLVQESEFRVNQSTLSGESHPVRKTADAVLQPGLGRSELPNLVFAGTTAAAGTGKAVVFATGMATEFGKIAHLTQSVQAELSPLQREMKRVTQVVTVVAVSVGVFFFLLAVLLVKVTLAESFIFAIGMIVAFVPEGLLPTVTLALAMATQRMAKRSALVKRLSAVETLGCVSVICTDKTGTLTQNEMTVRELWLPGADSGAAGRRLALTGVGYAPEGEIRERDRALRGDDDSVRGLLAAAALCNNARLLPPDEQADRWTILGDPTEAALIVAARKAGIDTEAEERRMPRLRELPFDSRRKAMSTVHERADRSRVVYVKGAPKEMLSLCRRAHFSGRDGPLDGPLHDAVLAANDDFARQGLRVLAVARRELPEGLVGLATHTVEIDLTFLGLVAMMDPPRPEVAEAVEKCHAAGIRIVMITGDYGLTAESIARRVGILKGPQPRIITGAELDTLDDASLKAALADEVLFARVAPEHKLRVASTLQDMGHVVAMTGDGVNDAPALKKADIGVAMGLSGTDVAKEAADMILTDDNFASIVSAVEEGRAVYANIGKFTTYIFTSNTPEAVPFVLYAFTAGRIPLALNVMHVLAVDLGTDLVPALALGAEPPEPGLMERPPRKLTEHIITPRLLARAYLWLGALQSLAAMAAFYFCYWTQGYRGQWLDLPGDGALYRSATAMALAAVVITQVGNLFAQRTERMSLFRLGWRRILGNRMIWIGIATELILIALIVYAPFMQRFIGTASFPLSNWLFLLAWTPSLWILDEVRKALARWRERRASERASRKAIAPA